MATSRPVMSLPSVSSTTRERRPLRMRVWWVSASPSSQGRPALWMEVRGAAPVPPSWPEMSTTWAPALATPAAMVPTPASLTSFTRDAGLPVGVFQVVDQLGQVLDGVDVVVGRRGDQGDAGGGVAGPGDPGVDLSAGQVAALAGLGPLGHLDLDLLGADQVLAGDAEAAGGHLLDGGAPLGRAAAPAPRRPRRSWTCRPAGSWRWPGTRGPPGRWSRSSWRRS